MAKKSAEHSLVPGRDSCSAVDMGNVSSEDDTSDVYPASPSPVPAAPAQSPSSAWRPMSPEPPSQPTGPVSDHSCNAVLAGIWTPFATETGMRLTGVRPPSPVADVIQVHMVAPNGLAGCIIGKQGSRIQEIA